MPGPPPPPPPPMMSGGGAPPPPPFGGLPASKPAPNISALLGDINTGFKLKKVDKSLIHDTSQPTGVAGGGASNNSSSDDRRGGSGGQSSGPQMPIMGGGGGGLQEEMARKLAARLNKTNSTSSNISTNQPKTNLIATHQHNAVTSNNISTPNSNQNKFIVKSNSNSSLNNSINSQNNSTPSIKSQNNNADSSFQDRKKALGSLFQPPGGQTVQNTQTPRGPTKFGQNKEFVQNENSLKTGNSNGYSNNSSYNSNTSNSSSDSNRKPTPPKPPPRLDVSRDSQHISNNEQNLSSKNINAPSFPQKQQTSYSTNNGQNGALGSSSFKNSLNQISPPPSSTNKAPPPPPPPPLLTPTPSRARMDKIFMARDGQSMQQPKTHSIAPPPPPPPVPPPQIIPQSHQTPPNAPPPPPPPTLPPPPIPISHRPVPPVPTGGQGQGQKPRAPPQPPTAKPASNMYEDLERRFQFSPIPNYNDMPKHFAPPGNRQYPSAKFSEKQRTVR